MKKLKQGFKVLNDGFVKLLSASPMVGKYYRTKLDLVILQKLKVIDAQFSSPVVRFSNQLHDLYDCLKDLEGYLEIDEKDLHGFGLTMHTKSSKVCCELLEQLSNNYTVTPENYFKESSIRTTTDFLDWYSDEESLNDFVLGITILLYTYCNRVSKTPTQDGEPFKGEEVACNESTEAFIGSRYFKLLILDLLQALAVVLELRVGG